MPSDSELTDSRGRPLHGSALQTAREAAVRKREAALAEAERHLAGRAAAMAAERSVVRAQSRALLALLAQPGGLPGPDVLRRVLSDPEDAMAICASAGLNPAAVQARWADTAPAAPAQSRSDFWGQFPDHNEDFLRGTRSLADVTAEHEQRQVARAARRESPVLWRTRDGGAVTDGEPAVMGASFGPGGAPVQRSAVHADVPELRSEG